MVLRMCHCRNMVFRITYRHPHRRVRRNDNLLVPDREDVVVVGFQRRSSPTSVLWPVGFRDLEIGLEFPEDYPLRRTLACCLCKRLVSLSNETKTEQNKNDHISNLFIMIIGTVYIGTEHTKAHTASTDAFKAEADAGYAAVPVSTQHYIPQLSFRVTITISDLLPFLNSISRITVIR